VLSIATGGFRLSFRATRNQPTIKELSVNKPVCAEISAPRTWANPAEASAQDIVDEGSLGRL
jgi:hypothetical protein